MVGIIFTDVFCSMQTLFFRNRLIITKSVKNIYIKNYKFFKNPSSLDYSLNYFQSINENDVSNLWCNRLGILPLYKINIISLVTKYCIGTNFDSYCYQFGQHKLSL